MKIAVFIDAGGRAASLYQAGIVRVYESDADGWRQERDIPFALHEQMGLSEIRTSTLTMLTALDGCRHFVATAIHGALLSYFDGMGIHMWRLNGEPAGFLTRIQRFVEENAQRQQAAVPRGFIKPGQGDGEYNLNLIDALKSDGALTSKQVLLPFFRQTPFRKIEIVCDHLPKWFQRELPALKLALTIAQNADGRCHAVVFPLPDRT
ncbi:Fe-only nitrogenase accessory protein AnfO [Acerihabitans arboris]|uniref:Fe-only nitrogenase accessory protein AnfO n=1 Tax=Acerihabitans arboris TaxID=2691583 RepID=A0A845SPX1_9GAMM|nr:Fe-only nitrogenase accessory protein AnfO [Acerihabitans arboris]NDL64641.1 Fe-only nitrogenase accessory protein AnfO [Acerihabitans arboris]